MENTFDMCHYHHFIHGYRTNNRVIGTLSNCCRVEKERLVT